MEVTLEQALRQGVAAHKEGKLQDAERVYRAILKSQPLHPDANHNLGILAVSFNKAVAALPLFKTALEANPKIEQFWLSYIDCLIKLDNFDDANQALVDARQRGIVTARLQVLETQLQSRLVHDSSKLRQQPGGQSQSDQDELLPAIELRDIGKYKEAQEWLNKFIESDSNHPEALSLLSQVFLLDKKEVEAERALLAAASINSELPSIYCNQARLLLKQSKPVEALEKAQLGYEQSPENIENLLVLATCLGANQKDSEALPIIERVLSARPNYAEAYASRALIRFRANDISGAIKDAEITVSLKPHLAQMWLLLSSLYYQRNDISKAIEVLRSAHEKEPGNAGFLVQLGEFLRQDDKVSEAINVLEQATELAPQDADAWTNLGAALQQDKNTVNAKIVYEKALALNPQSAAISSNLGAIAKDAGEWVSALQYFEKALEIEPNRAEVHDNLGVTLKELGRSEEAEASFTQAIALKPDFAEAHKNLGITLQKLSKFDEAEASLRQAISLRPDYAEAHDNLLTCLYRLNKKAAFFDELDYLISHDKANAVIGSLTCRSALKYGLEKPNLFCGKPLQYVSHTDLNTQCDFEEVFVEKAKAILNEKRIPNRKQLLLMNGDQTSGNLFDIQNDATDKIQEVIRLEIEKYRLNFKNSEEGLIKKWPMEYSLYGWLISMKSGGELQPHIHEQGWLSGSVYINVPPKSIADSGNLVVSLGEEEDAIDTRINVEKVINVVTGSLVLFPASLMHHTIPFESEEERIVLAFDVKPK